MTTSILIPCHNAATRIGRAIESAIIQNPDEIIVIDDASTDGSADIARVYSQQITLVEHNTNQGVQRTRNELFGLASGEWIQYLDADDYLYPKKIELQLADLTDEVGYTDFCIDRGSAYPEKYSKRTCNYRLPDDILEGLVNWFPIPQTNCLLFPRVALEECPWDESMAGAHEHKLIVDLLKAGFEFKHTPILGCLYHQNHNEGQVTASLARILPAREQVQEELFAWLADTGEAEQYQSAIDLVRRKMAHSKHLAGLQDASELVEELKA